MNTLSPTRGSQSGQAAVEAALTLPLVVFLILGTMQMFLAFHARVLAHYAVFQATRAGSISHGDCMRMQDAAVLALLPSFRSFLGASTAGSSRPEKLANAFGEYKRNGHRFLPAADGGHDGSIVWIMRELGGNARSVSGSQDRGFDSPGHLMRLETRMVYWFPMKVPFANWVISRMFLARLGLEEYHAANPLLLAEKDAAWVQSPDGFSLPGAMASELMSRVGRQQYTLPIETTFTMRMMTPAKANRFASMNCPW
ncbi:TadE family protein [Hyalangium gracile]|uniref:TadE family protein n=1 Tax=Hyalangium gracile TaxID=394092 RepID=UPI001CCA2C9D|nr:TadE family protein [Hyalangium gracile]